MNGNKRLTVLAGILFSLAAGLIFLILSEKEPAGDAYVLTQTQEDASGTVEDTKGEEAVPETSEKGTLFVHVCGEVNAPGVYELEEGVRVAGAIEAAGGLTDQAAGDAVNQALTVEDGQQIYIPSLAEVSEGALSGSEAFARDQDGRVNLNTADKELLMTLPGIGSVRADAIIAYRTQHGGFASEEEIMNISGIKESVYEQLKDRITVK